MSRLNYLLKYFVYHVNAILLIIGLAIMGVSLYALFANWGSLDRSFFLGAGIVSILLGFIITLMSCLGCVGVTHQTTFNGPWTGRRILTIYEIVIFGILIGIVYMLCTSVIAVASLGDSYDALQAGQYPEFSQLEISFSGKFNSFFFAATTACNDAKYTWFWQWVSDHCSSRMSKDSCERCADSVAFCGVDEETCYASYLEQGAECPYTACRLGAISFLLDKIRPFSYFLIALAGFQIILVAANCMLVCYTQRDDLSLQLYKSGTLSSAQFEANMKRMNGQLPR